MLILPFVIRQRSDFLTQFESNRRSSINHYAVGLNLLNVESILALISKINAAVIKGYE